MEPYDSIVLFWGWRGGEVGLSSFTHETLLDTIVPPDYYNNDSIIKKLIFKEALAYWGWAAHDTWSDEPHYGSSIGARSAESSSCKTPAFSLEQGREEGGEGGEEACKLTGKITQMISCLPLP